MARKDTKTTTKLIAASIPLDEAQKLEELAARDMRSVANLVQIIIHNWLVQLEQPEAGTTIGQPQIRIARFGEPVISPISNKSVGKPEENK